MTTNQDRPDTACGGTPLQLAGGGVGRVVACSCGNIHIDVEYVTLRFAPDAFAELAAMLSQAQRRLAAQPGAPSVVADLAAMH